MTDKVLSLLGLCQRARLLKSGEFSCEQAIKNGDAQLMIIATDASENTKDKFISSCKYYQVPYREYGEKEQLGNAIGKGIRASLVVQDKGFATKIVSLIDSRT